MKRILCLVLSLLLAVSLFVSCGTGDGNTDPQTETRPGTESITQAGTESDTASESASETESETETEEVFSVDPSHAKTPLMGWASWTLYHADISEEKITAAAQALVDLGLAELGYTYVNIDDGFQYGRGEDGRLIVHPERFPDGMKQMADVIHSLGLNAGIYSDAGALTCGYLYSGQTENDDVGLYGFEEQDLRMYFDEWGYDFIKVDWCGGAYLGLSRKEQYTGIGEIIQKIAEESGRTLLYNICCWEFPGEWASEVACSWRTGSDISPNFASILYQIDRCKPLARYQSPGHVNDPDMLEVGMGMTAAEDRSHFAMWCMLSAPLMLGNDLTAISPETLEIISNRALIEIDQDPACIPATVLFERDGVEVWQKDLGKAGSDTTAIALLNRSDERQTVTVTWDELGYGAVTEVTDLWSGDVVSPENGITVTLEPHDTAVFRMTGTRRETVKEVQADILVTEGEDIFDLSEFGKSDWICFGTLYGVVGVSKKTDIPYLSVTFSDVTERSECLYTACFWMGDGEDRAPSGFTSDGSCFRSVGSSFDIQVLTDQTPVLLSAAIGVGGAEVTVEILDGNRVIRTETISGAQSEEAPATVLTVLLSATESGYLTVRLTLTDRGEDPSLSIYGVALSPVAEETEPELTDAETARGLLESGAVLLDVRSPEEYAEGHPAGAVSLPYDTILTTVTELYPDRDTVILTYCSRAKRSLQAYFLLRYLGYTNVYWIGSCDPYAT